MKKKGMSALFSAMVILILSLAFMFVVVSFVIPYFQTIQDVKIQNNSVEHLRLINKTINEIKIHDINSYKVLNVNPLSNIYIDTENKKIFIEQYINNRQFYESYREENIGNIQIIKERQHFIYILDLDDIDIDVDFVVSPGKQELIFMVVDYDVNPIITIRPHHKMVDREPPQISVFATDDNSEQYFFGNWITSDYINISIDYEDQSKTTIYYCIDEFDECVPDMIYTEDINITTPGYYFLKYYAVDSWTNQTPLYTKEIKIERCLFPTSGRWNVDGKEVCGSRIIDVPELIYIENDNKLLFYDCNINLNTTASTSVIRGYNQGFLRMKNSFIQGTVSGHYPYIYLYDNSQALLENVDTPIDNPGRVYVRGNSGTFMDIVNSVFYNGYFYGDANFTDSIFHYRTYHYSGSTTNMKDSGSLNITYLYNGSIANVEDSFFSSLRFYGTQANITNTTSSNFFLYAETGHTVDINDFDYTTMTDYRFLSDNGMDINIADCSLGTAYFSKTTGNMNINNSNIYGYYYYNYNNTTSTLENSNVYVLYYYAYENIDLLLENLISPASNYTKTFTTEGNSTLEIINSNYDILYSYSNNTIQTTYKDSTIFLLYFLGNSNNLAENINPTYTIYAYGNSRNIIKDSTLETSYFTQFYNTSETTFYNTQLLPTGTRQTRLYNTAKMHFMDSNCVLDKLYLNSGTHNPTISGYVNITSLDLWGSGNVLNRYLPFIAKYEDNYYAPNVNIQIKDGVTIIDEGITDINGFVELLISADNSADPYKEYDVYANGNFIKTITILENTANGIEIIVPEPGLVGYWLFDENEGSLVIDNSINDNNGTIIGGVTWKEGYGKNNVFLEFDGTGYIDLGTPSDFNFTNTDDFTMSIWVKKNNNPESGNTSGIFAKTTTYGIDYHYGTGTNNDVRVGIRNTTDGQYQIITNPPNNLLDWTKITYVYESEKEDGIRVYINGDLKNSRTTIGLVDFSSPTTPLRIGTSIVGGSSHPFIGFIDAPRLYNKALTSEEILALYNATKDLYVNLDYGKVGHWMFDEGEGTTVYDSSGHDNHGEIIGDVNWFSGKGQGGYTLEFDGSDNYVEILHSTEFNFGTDSFSISGWIKSNPGPDDFPIFFTKGLQELRAYFRNSDGAMRAKFGDGDFISPDDPTNVLNNEWNHLIWIYDSIEDEVHFYINTNLDDSVKANAGSVDNIFDIGIGGASYSAHGFSNALLDDVRIYNRDLSAQEISALYNITKTNYGVE